MRHGPKSPALDALPRRQARIRRALAPGSGAKCPRPGTQIRICVRRCGHFSACGASPSRKVIQETNFLTDKDGLSRTRPSPRTQIVFCVRARPKSGFVSASPGVSPAAGRPRPERPSHPRRKTPLVGNRVPVVLLASIFAPILPVVCNIFYVGRPEHKSCCTQPRRTRGLGAICDRRAPRTDANRRPASKLLHTTGPGPRASGARGTQRGTGPGLRLHELRACVFLSICDRNPDSPRPGGHEPRRARPVRRAAPRPGTQMRIWVTGGHKRGFGSGVAGTYRQAGRSPADRLTPGRNS